MGDLNKNLSYISNILNSIFLESCIPPHKLRLEVEKISNAYLMGKDRVRDIKPEIYALYFMPEHLPKIMFVLYELITMYPLLIERMERIYDLGCGVGTAAVGIRLLLGNNRPLTLIDTNKEMLKLACKILNRLDSKEHHPIEVDYLESNMVFEHPSLCVFMNTLSENIDRLEEITQMVLKIIEKNKDNIAIIIEPISDRGKDIVKKLRTIFGEKILMPCTGKGECPLINKFSDVCRFTIDQKISKQLETVITAGHRMAKFYYLVLYGGNTESVDCTYRVLSYPISRQYGFDLKICNQRDVKLLRLKSRGSKERRFIKRIIPDTLLEIRGCEKIDFKKTIRLDEIEVQIINSPSNVVTLLEHTDHS